MLSVIVIVKNEENLIRTCLKSVNWADEIIVADNGSTDDTLKIAKEYINERSSPSDKIIKFKGQDFATLRNKAFEKATYDWVLYVDADERVLAPLKEEIEQLIREEKFSAFAISRKNIIFGSEQKYGPFWPDWVIRLFKKQDFETWVGKVHEYGKFKGKLGYTKNSFLHLTHRGVDQMIIKNLEWSKIDAKLRFDAKHPKMVGWRFLRIFLTEFFYQGIVRKGFLSGTIGVMDSIIQTFSLFTTYVRLWEMQQSEKLSDKYDRIDEELKKNNFNL